MNITRSFWGVGAASALMLVVACGNGGDASEEGEPEVGSEGEFVDELTFGTASTTGIYYPLANEYGAIFEQNIEDLTAVESVSSDGSIANLGGIARGEFQLGLAQSDTFALAVRGEDEFEGADISNVGWVAGLYPEAMHLMVSEASGIESIEDLEGADIAIGAPGSGTRVLSDAILEAYGIEEDDYTSYEEEFFDAATLLQDGIIDATLYTVGTPNAAVEELSYGADLRILSIGEDELAGLTDGTDFEAFTMESDAYDFLDEDVQTISATAALFASTNEVSEDIVYEMTKLIFEESDRITLVQAEMIRHDNALLGLGDNPLHPGAERYYEEVGLDIP